MALLTVVTDNDALVLVPVSLVELLIGVDWSTCAKLTPPPRIRPAPALITMLLDPVDGAAMYQIDVFSIPESVSISLVIETLS